MMRGDFCAEQLLQKKWSSDVLWDAVHVGYKILLTVIIAHLVRDAGECGRSASAKCSAVTPLRGVIRN